MVYCWRGGALLYVLHVWLIELIKWQNWQVLSESIWLKLAETFYKTLDGRRPLQQNFFFFYKTRNERIQQQLHYCILVLDKTKNQRIIFSRFSHSVLPLANLSRTIDTTNLMAKVRKEKHREKEKVLAKAKAKEEEAAARLSLKAKKDDKKGKVTKNRKEYEKEKG